MLKSLGFIFFTALYFLPVSLSAQRTLPATYATSVKVNYVRNFDIKKPGVNPNTLTGEVLKDVRQSTSYLDGLGRPYQCVVKEGSL